MKKTLLTTLIIIGAAVLIIAGIFTAIGIANSVNDQNEKADLISGTWTRNLTGYTITLDLGRDGNGTMVYDGKDNNLDSTNTVKWEYLGYSPDDDGTYHSDFLIRNTETGKNLVGKIYRNNDLMQVCSDVTKTSDGKYKWDDSQNVNWFVRN